MVGLGIYHAIASGRYGSLYITALGVILLTLVVWGSVRRRH
jgi:hypothetical protein